VEETVAVKTINMRFGVHISGLTGLRILLLGHVGFREKINRETCSAAPLSLEIFGRFSKTGEIDAHEV